MYLQLSPHPHRQRSSEPLGLTIFPTSWWLPVKLLITLPVANACAVYCLGIKDGGPPKSHSHRYASILYTPILILVTNTGNIARLPPENTDDITHGELSPRRLHLSSRLVSILSSQKGASGSGPTERMTASCAAVVWDTPASLRYSPRRKRAFRKTLPVL